MHASRLNASTLRPDMMTVRPDYRRLSASTGSPRPAGVEAHGVADQDQVFGKIAPTGGSSPDIRKASLEILVNAHGHVDTPGAAPCCHNDSRIEI
jgi:hypothetical protein